MAAILDGHAESKDTPTPAPNGKKRKATTAAPGAAVTNLLPRLPFTDFAVPLALTPAPDSDDKYKEAKQTLRILAVQSESDDTKLRERLQEIDRMSKKQTFEEVEILKIKKDLHFINGLATKTRVGMGQALDMVLQADGCIAQKFADDQTLQTALMEEFSFASKYLNNKAKIGICLASDTANGYNDSRAAKKAKGMIPPSNKPDQEGK